MLSIFDELHLVNNLNYRFQVDSGAHEYIILVCLTSLSLLRSI
uniref:DEGP2 n=1 Tax=Arundo donax TaxID=35708 RepID=A0A0A9CNW3_ARUDO